MKNIDVECQTSRPIYVRIRASEQEGQVNLTADNTVIVERQPVGRRLPGIADSISSRSIRKTCAVVDNRSPQGVT